MAVSQFTVYRSTDVGAPVMSGGTGTFITLLDACLVHGYGTQTGAGWTKPFSGSYGTGQQVYGVYLTSGQGFYLQVCDAGSGTAQEAQICGFESMTEFNTEIHPFPVSGQGVNQFRIIGNNSNNGANNSSFLAVRKSASNDTAPRAWIVVADAKTFYVFILANDQTNNYTQAGFGEFYSYGSNDKYRCFINGRDQSNTTNIRDTLLSSQVTTLQLAAGHYIDRGHTGLGGSVQVGKHANHYLVDATTAWDSMGAVPFTNPEDGVVYISPYWITDPTTVPIGGVRGKMRGLWMLCHATATFSDGDTFNGTGNLAGKSFLCIKFMQDVYDGASGSANRGIAIIETSNTVLTN